MASGDPRLSLEERYKNHEGFVRAVRQAAQQLVLERFLLEDGADAFVNAAEASEVLQ
ncbi:MAG TPA: alpha/beta hydrolase domain-containing protein [Casimicrobiaceae bacterium]